MYLAHGARALAAGTLGVALAATAAAGLALTPPGPGLAAAPRAHVQASVTITPGPSGNNTVSFRQGGRSHTVRGFGARSGYNLATGLGTVNAQDLVTELARLAGH